MKASMLVISRLQQRNSESKWVGVLCEIQYGVHFVYSRGRPSIFLELHGRGAPMAKVT